MNNIQQDKTRQTGEKNRLVPKLRFPEFLGAGEWSKLHGNNVFEQINNKDHNSDLPVLAVTQEYGAIPRSMIDYHVSVADKSIEGYKIVEIGDFVISLRSFQGGIEYSMFKGICSPAYVILRLKNENSAGYFRQFLKTGRFIEQLTKNLEGLRDGKMINYKQFSELLLPIPSIPEQQKIANCLSSLDDLITAQTEKLTTLKTHKKGLMQQLFPAEGKTLPQLRFPEFRGEWEEKKLGSIGIFTGGGTPSKANASYWEGENPWISSSDIFEDNIQDIHISRFISDKAIQENATKVVPANSILIVSRVGVGKLAITKAPICTSQDFTNFTPRKDDFMFLAYYLKKLKNTFISFNQGMAIKGFTKDDISGLEIFLPQLKEQQKIADCFTSLDNLITAQTQKLAALKSHKKGLMQQLFPTWEEREQ